MINVKDNVWKPSEGYKYITNGDIYASEIHMRVGDSIDRWRDTNEEPPVSPEPGEEITSKDYEAALN